MLPVALCFAAADSALARELADYLELNLDVRIEEAPVSDWLDLLGSVETALAVDRVIALLTPASLPERLPRERWDAITDPKIAWVLAEDCPYPPMLARRKFFDVRGQGATGFRAIRRWLMSGELAKTTESPFESKLREFVDRPAAVILDDADALTAAGRFFTIDVTVDTRERTPTSIAAELATAFDLDRSVDLESMLTAVRRITHEKRCLVVWHGPDPGLIPEVGRSSFVRIPVEDAPVVIAPEEMKRTVIECQRGRSEPPARADLDRTLSHAFAASGQWPAARDLARVAFEYLKSEYRLAEAYGLLESLKKGAEFYAEDPVIADCRRDLAWIADQWAYGATSGCEISPQLGFDW